mmetsp:Transcript_122476/g.212500  ORF Transcript_122476/g.212500 Transcript_122476/m.212500 type:complete len:84 (-) Transcript_122476:11-262(-)
MWLWGTDDNLVGTTRLAYVCGGDGGGSDENMEDAKGCDSLAGLGSYMVSGWSLPLRSLKSSSTLRLMPINNLIPSGPMKMPSD